MDPQIYREMGLNDSEYAQILETLGREPSITEDRECMPSCGRSIAATSIPGLYWRLFAKYKEAQDTGAVENAGRD